MAIFFVLAMLAGAVPPGIVIRPVAQMYSSATEDADVVSQAIYAARVDLLERNGEWIRVRTADAYTGWMPAAALRCLRAGERIYASAGRVAEVDSLFAHLYRERSATSRQPLLTVPYETRLEVVAEPAGEEAWIQVRLPDDRSAWVQRGDVVFEPARLTIAETIVLARRFLGLPYTWGGTSSFGYDCSGFMQMLCRRRGFSLPRDAQPQSEWAGGAPVEPAGLQPGDLLYFSGSGKKIIHTGMYIGGGEFIHSSRHERPVVQIGRVEDPHWADRLVAARRIR